MGGHYQSKWDWGRVGLSTLAGGAVAELTGGDFGEGALFAPGTASIDYLAELPAELRDETFAKTGQSGYSCIEMHVLTLSARGWSSQLIARVRRTRGTGCPAAGRPWSGSNRGLWGLKAVS
jgi:hypothetical protein